MSSKYRRLLNLYSLNKLRHAFSVEETTKADVIVAIADDYSVEEIVEFCLSHHSTTKHHLHLFDFSELELADLPEEPIDLPNLVRTNQTSTSKEWFYLLDIDYQIFLKNPLESETLSFYWPVWISCSGQRLQIRFTKLEKSMSTYFDRTRIVRVTKELDETKIQGLILAGLDLPDDLMPTDLNRGLKDLWSSDVIDAPVIQYKDTKSVSKSTMDSDFLAKRDDPELYEKVRDKPLFKMKFKWLRNSDEMSIDHFTAEASRGVLTFGTYSDLENGAEYVAREILNSN